tara:strand:+ start:432 stop:551 length:120 start_codon:yes stop_codon:yes gene_type:complete
MPSIQRMAAGLEAVKYLIAGQVGWRFIGELGVGNKHYSR